MVQPPVSEGTEALLADETAWQDVPFLERLDVIFAGLCFDAIVQWETHQEHTPRAWQPPRFSERGHF